MHRSEQALRAPRGWGSQISRQSAHESCKVISPAHLQEIFLALISIRSWVDPRTIVRLEGLCQWKIPVAPLAIETANFRLVANALTDCTTAYPRCGRYWSLSNWYLSGGTQKNHDKPPRDIMYPIFHSKEAPPTLPKKKKIQKESYTREAFIQYHNTIYCKTFSVTIQGVETLVDRTSPNTLFAFFWE